jgi:hypothetical protein
MNFLKKGPEIKFPGSLSEIKVPGFLRDSYDELNDRHLLPLVVILIVAIVAVPIALKENVEPSSTAGLALEESAEASASSPIVVSQSLPGLRNYHKRLKGLESRNPFEQQFSDAKNAEGGGAEGATTGGSSEGSTSESSSSPEGGGSESGGSPQGTPGELKYFSWTIDARVVPVSTNGKPSKAKPTVRHNLPELTMLPGKDTPAVIFMGTTSDEKKALMLVSSNVTAVFGDATCVLGGETCEMLALEKGVPETFVYGGNKRIFRIEVQRIRLVETDKLNNAPLGESNHGSGSKHVQPDPQAAVQGAVAHPGN